MLGGYHLWNILAGTKVIPNVILRFSLPLILPLILPFPLILCFSAISKVHKKSGPTLKTQHIFSLQKSLFQPHNSLPLWPQARGYLGVK